MNGREIAYGFRHNWIDAGDCVALALAAYKAGLQQTTAEIDLAMLMQSDFDNVGSVISRIESAAPDGNASQVWLYLCLAHAYSRRAEMRDPLAEVDFIYDDFGFPSEMKPLVRYLPGPNIGREGIMKRWEDYVEERSRYYSERKRRLTTQG